MSGYSDIVGLPEDQRIELIGNTVMCKEHQPGDAPRKIGFVVNDDVTADRYIDKLQKQFPLIRVISRGRMGVGETVAVVVGPPLQ